MIRYILYSPVHNKPGPPLLKTREYIVESITPLLQQVNIELKMEQFFLTINITEEQLTLLTLILPEDIVLQSPFEEKYIT